MRVVCQCCQSLHQPSQPAVESPLRAIACSASKELSGRSCYRVMLGVLFPCLSAASPQLFSELLFSGLFKNVHFSWWQQAPKFVSGGIQKLRVSKAKELTLVRTLCSLALPRPCSLGRCLSPNLTWLPGRWSSPPPDAGVSSSKLLLNWWLLPNACLPFLLPRCICDIQ